MGVFQSDALGGHGLHPVCAGNRSFRADAHLAGLATHPYNYTMPQVSLLAVILFAQVNGAVLTGSVRDGQTRLPVAGALVALPDIGRTAFADAEGRYRFVDVPAGPQHVTVRSLGYEARMLHALVPAAGQLEINITLRALPITLQPVEVRPRVPLPGSPDTQAPRYLLRSLTMAAIRNDPMQSEPDVFLSLAGAGVVLLPEAAKGVHIQGGSADQTAFLLDGIPVFNPYHAAGMFSAWNPDALATLQVSANAPSPQLPDALSGAVIGLTRRPGESLTAQGSFSTSQARVTVDGPLVGTQARYLVSIRSGFPDFMSPRDEASYLRGETGDALAKVELHAVGGRLELLGYQSESELSAATIVNPTQPPARNTFEWESESLGLSWERHAGGSALRLVAWSAQGTAAADWLRDATLLRSERHDFGVQSSIEHGAFQIGARFQHTRTNYSLRDDSARVEPWDESRLPAGTLFLRHVLSRRTTELTSSAALTAAAGEYYVSPRVHIEQHIGNNLTLSASLARTQQFAQSLRNAESVVGHIFPADVYVAAGANGVPVAESDQATLAAELRTNAGITLALYAFGKTADDVLLVAPVDGHAFSTHDFTVGRARAQGISADASFSSARLGVSVRYGWQRVRYEYAANAYTPDHAATHILDAGAIYFATPSLSFRVGGSAAAGRRSTALTDAFEWEACNLLDQGCEFGGSPGQDANALGETTLPAYLRVDAGARKHWHVRAGGRSATIAAFGSFTNVFGRRNVLTYAPDASTGALSPVEMRPRAPLVLGIDWRY